MSLRAVRVSRRVIVSEVGSAVGEGHSAASAVPLPCCELPLSPRLHSARVELSHDGAAVWMLLIGRLIIDIKVADCLLVFTLVSTGCEKIGKVRRFEGVRDECVCIYWQSAYLKEPP